MKVLNTFDHIDNTDMKYIQFLPELQVGSSGWEINCIKCMYFLIINLHPFPCWLTSL